MPRFAETWCSQCGRGFGPGDHGYSHCVDHKIERIEHRIRELDAWLYNNPGASRWRVLEELETLEAQLTEAYDAVEAMRQDKPQDGWPL